MDKHSDNDIAKCDVCATTEGKMWLNPERKAPSDPTWLCAEHIIEVMRKQIDTAFRLLAIQRQENEPMFPISTQDPYPHPHPAQIPWSMAELAYSKYARQFGTSQSLQRIAERGGFGPAEMDMFCPGWIAQSLETTTLRNKLVDAREDLVDRDQEIFVLKGQLRVLGANFDEIAAAVGWTKERCNQTGDSPLDVARELMRDVTEQKGQIVRARAELDVAARKIAELTKGSE